jgi:hypothetical protein
MHARLRRLYWIVLVVNRRSRTCKIVDLVDLYIERECDIVPDQLEVRVTNQMLNVTARSSKKVIDAEDDCPLRQQTLTQVRTEETSTAGNQHACF